MYILVRNNSELQGGFMSEIKITKSNFQSEVLESDKPVLVDFWADWCGPCKMQGPVLAEVAEEHSEIKVGKCNVDEEMELAAQFNVMSIPFLALFKDGKMVKASAGFMPKITLEGFIED